MFSSADQRAVVSEDMDTSCEDMETEDMETTSDVTLESHDTWGGLAPAPPQAPLSEEVIRPPLGGVWVLVFVLFCF